MRRECGEAQRERTGEGGDGDDDGVKRLKARLSRDFVAAAIALRFLYTEALRGKRELVNEVLVISLEELSQAVVSLLAHSLPSPNADRLALLREDARKAGSAEDGARLLARARRDGALSLKRPVRVYLTWSHPDAELELRVSDGGGPPAPPEDLWPQFGLLSWRSHRDAAADLPLEVEVRRSGGNRALPFSAELVVVRGLPFHGLCPHHLLPYTGTAAVAYLPDTRLAGFGRLGDLVTCFTRRLTLQERIGEGVVALLTSELGALGALCRLTLTHSCLIARGERKTGAIVETLAVSGTFSRACPDRDLAFAALHARSGP